MCAGIYTITRQVRDIQKYGIRDPNDVTEATVMNAQSSKIQQGDNEPFFQEKKEDD